MSPRILNALAAATAAVCVAGAANASTVFDNGPPLGGGLEVTEFRVADDFSFASDTRLGGGGVYLNAIGNWDGVFQYDIFSDAGGGMPGVSLQHGSASVTPVDVGASPGDPGGLHNFLFQFDFTSPFLAQAGVTYWLSPHARADFRDNDGIFWSFTDNNSTHGSAFADADPTSPWSVGLPQEAFFLTSAGVPEPGTWALMLLGFGAAGVALRARPARATSAS